MPEKASLIDRQARLIIDSAIDYGIIGLDLDGVITSWNSGATNIMGWSAAETLGRHGAMIFTPEDVDARIPASEMSAAIRTGRGIDERWHLKKDGSRFWANGEMMPLRNEAGAIEGYVKILRDRTAQHESAVALTASEDNYQRLHDAMDEGFCLIEVRCDDADRPIDYRFLKVNPAFERQTGLVDAAGSWMRELRPDHEEHWFGIYAKIALTGESARFELPAKALNRHYEVFAYRVGDPADRTVAVLFSDVSQRRSSESRLQDSESHLRKLTATLRDNERNLRLLLDTIAEGFYAVDRHGVTTTCNAAFLRMMGFTRAEEIIGRKLHDLIHHSHPDGTHYAEAECPIYRAASQGIAVHVREEMFFPRNRPPIWMEYRATPIMHDGQLQGAICTFQDVTEQRERDQAREEATKRKTALLQLGESLRNLSEPATMAFIAAEIVGRTLGVSAVGLGQLDVSTDTLVIDQEWTAESARSIVRRHAMSSYGSYLQDLLAGRMVAIDDVWADPRTSAHPESFEAIGVRSFMNAPVIEQGWLVALFCVVSDRVRNWTEEEVQFVREVAERTRIAIERRRAEQRLKRAEKLRFGLADLSDRLRNIDDAAAMQMAAAEVIGRTLDVNRVGYGLVASDGETFTVPSDWTVPGYPSLAGVYRMDDYGLYAADLRAGSTVVIDDVRVDPRTAADPELLASVSVGALINHPIVEQDRTVAILYVNDPQARAWREDEVGFIKEAGDRLRQATERRNAEVQLRGFNLRLEKEVEARTAERDRMWEISPDLMVMVNDEGFYQRLNPAWTAVLGYDPAELIGIYATDLTHPDDRPSTQEALSIAQNGRLPGFEMRYRHKDGSYRWIEWTAAAGPGEVFATGRDVTQAKEARERLEQAEEQLRQSQKMEAVGQLTGGLAHDFNNLLAGISGAVQLMQTRLGQGRYNEFERYLTLAQGACKRAAALTHRLLAFSRRQTLDPKPTDADALVHGMRELIQRTVGPAIPITVTTAPDLWNVLVDPSQLENSLLNLCINARDAMPDGGRIVIDAANRQLDEAAARALDLPPGPYLTLRVQDNGCGMPPEVATRVFEPFFTTKPMGEGTGLGLSMVYGFAQQSDGQVRIESRVGEGTTVCIYLPRLVGKTITEGSGVARAEPKPPQPGATVLVVDDEPTVRLLVTEILVDLGYTAIEASDSVGGLKILQSDARIDLLITDVGLPGGMNGRQMADAARVIRRDLKVIFITGYAEGAVFGKSPLAPGMTVLTKPFSIDAVGVAIQALLDAKG